MTVQIIEILVVMFVSLTVSLILTVPIHELGHLIGGLISGYRFTSISVFRLSIHRDYDRFRISSCIGKPIGQCLMNPRCIGQNPVMLISGGIVANLTVGIVSLTAGLTVKNIKAMIFCICFGGINFAMGLLNAIPDSPTNDGSTLKDATRSSTHAEMYNRIMMVYSELEAGRKYKELSEEILEAPDIYDSTLAAELALYRYYRIRDLYSDDVANRNLIRIELFKLAKYTPKTGVTEVVENV